MDDVTPANLFAISNAICRFASASEAVVLLALAFSSLLSSCTVTLELSDGAAVVAIGDEDDACVCVVVGVDSFFSSVLSLSRVTALSIAPSTVVSVPAAVLAADSSTATDMTMMNRMEWNGTE